MPLDQNDRDRLVEALLECTCLSSVNSRDAIVRDLPSGIKDLLNLRGGARDDVSEIVRVCLQFPGGLERLLQRVRFFEGESFAWIKLDEVARGVLLEQVNPGPSAPKLVTAEPAAVSALPLTESQPKPPIQVFFSYAHKDETLRDELSNHLAILKWQGVIDEWHDRQIPAGDEWEEAIDDRINQAQVILLLISSDFLASKYCHQVEMKRALERHDKREAVVIPIILRPCSWRGALFGKLQALPKDAKAVTTWPDRDEAFTNVAEGIRRAIERIR